MIEAEGLVTDLTYTDKSTLLAITPETIAAERRCAAASATCRRTRPCTTR